MSSSYPRVERNVSSLTILSISCDTFVGATGVDPKTSFMPAEMLTASRYIDADCSLRLPGLYLVYAIGDCAPHSKNIIQDVYDTVSILLQNLKNDLLTWESRTEYPHGNQAAEDHVDQLEDIEYIQNPTVSQLMPMSKFGGVGTWFGHKLASPLVW
jgi:NADH dehydrogenase FAD-containing subunit